MASTVWRGYISFGLISVPVRLYRAARAERVSFRRLYRQAPGDDNEPEAVTKITPSPPSRRAAEASPPPAMEPRRAEPALAPIQQAAVLKGTDEVVPAASVVKGYEYDKDRFVVIEPEELKSIAPKTSAAMEIEEFVPLVEIDPVYFETSYYATPEEAGEKAYALLYRAMQNTGLVALARFAMHSREHIVVLRPGRTGLLAHTMFYASEVRADEEYRADPSVVTAKELDLAQTLIHSLAGSFDPARYRDSYRERLESMLERKVKGQPVNIAPTPLRHGEVVDIADALRRSLADLKKPPATEKAAQKPARTKRTHGKS
ncbi:MAG: Ku protein [Acidobacteriaceae bacterium]|nr:Ku protein [Acidobacteriaceae bacterium]